MPANRFISWFAVPVGSTLDIKVTGSDSNFNVTGVLVIDPGNVQQVSHAALVAGTSLVLDSAGTSYSVILAIAFLGQDETTVTVEASVTKPDGKPYGGPRPPHVCDGTNGSTDAAQVLTITRKAKE
jgi:hypothetical protein